MENIEPNAQNKYITGSGKEAEKKRRKIIIFDLNLPCP